MGALSVREAELSMRRRLGESEENLLVVQGNLARTYFSMGRNEEALQMERDVYSGRLKFNGEEDIHTLVAANNYAGSLIKSKRAREANALLRKVMPVARRSLGEDHGLTLTMRLVYTQTLDDL